MSENKTAAKKSTKKKSKPAETEAPTEAPTEAMVKADAPGALAETDDFDFGEFEGDGFEDQTRDDLKIPLLVVLQANSPALQDGSLPEGTKAGDLLNTVTGEVHKSVLIVPFKRDWKYMQWTPRDVGGGLVDIHEPDSDFVKALLAKSPRGPWAMEDGTVVRATVYVHAILVDENLNPLGPISIPFESTKIKSYQKFNTAVSTYLHQLPDGRKQKTPMYCHLTKVSTAFEKNNKGSWFNLVLQPARGSIKDSVIGKSTDAFKLAQQQKGFFDSGEAKVDYDSAAGGGGGGEQEGDLPF